MKKQTKKQREIPKAKLKEVEILKKLIESKKTILIVSIKNIPASQFQEIGKKLRGKAIIKVPKKSLIVRALDSSTNEAVKPLKKEVKESTAILFSDLDAFELALELVKNKTLVKAKPGQEAPEDIEIEAGPTDLVPGPAISELGALGIQIQIEKGKIHIKAPKIITKKGEKISQGAADVMNKLDIKPFSVGFEPLCALDGKEGKIYLEIKINPEETLNELKQAFSKALAFCVEIGYASNDTIKFLIGKAASHEKTLNALIKEDESKEVNNEKIKDDNKPKEQESDQLTNENESEPLGETNTQNKTQEENK